MKKLFLVLTLLYLINYSCQEDISLPSPDLEGGMPLYEALNKRESQRDFDTSKKASLKIISQALWCCYGINRPEKDLKTVPSATAWFPLLTYVFLEDGVYLYEADGHYLTKVLDGDYREYTGTQTAIVKKAIANFVFIADFKKQSSLDEEHKMMYMYLDTGHVTMALSLFTASNGMKGFVRAMVDTNKLLDLLGLKEGDYYFTLAYSLGF
jgi:nitroreductase